MPGSSSVSIGESAPTCLPATSIIAPLGSTTNRTGPLAIALVGVASLSLPRFMTSTMASAPAIATSTARMASGFLLATGCGATGAGAYDGVYIGPWRYGCETIGTGCDGGTR